MIFIPELAEAFFHGRITLFSGLTFTCPHVVARYADMTGTVTFHLFNVTFGNESHEVVPGSSKAPS